MTTAGDAAPDRSRPDWIVRLHRETATEPPAASSGSALALAGNVIAHRGPGGAPYGAVTIHHRSMRGQLQQTPDVVDLRCESRDLPAARSAPPTTDLNHVVHIIFSRFDDPEAIERFLDATRGLIDEYIIGREAWFEVVADPTDAEGATLAEPIVDDVYVGRYPTLRAWEALHEIEPWKVAIETLEAEASTMFHLVVAPTVNRLAEHRGPGS